MRIDSAGNLVQPLSPGQQDPAPPPRRNQDVRGFQTFSELPEPAASGQPARPMDQMRAMFSFTFKSVIGGLVIAQIVIFIASCWLVTPRAFVKPTQQALWKIGSSNGPMEHCAFSEGGKFLVELRRPVTAIFLHTGLPHIIMNMIFQVMFGLKFEEAYGRRAFLALFFGTGICGNLLSDAFQHNGVGASTACYGLMGAFVAQVIIRWPTLTEYWRWAAKMVLISQSVFLVIWEVAQWSTLDHFGHAGGLLSGIALGMILTDDCQTKWRRWCILGLAIPVLACVVKISFVGFDVSSSKHCLAQWTLYDG